MKRISMKGKTVEEAVAGALKVLGLEREKIEYRVVSEGKGAVLGVFGGEDAEVEVREKVLPAELANEVLQEILNRMGLMAVSEIVESADDNVTLNVKGEDLGQIIGKDGATINSLQIILTTIVSRDFAERKRITVDAGGYRARRIESLEKMAKEVAEEVVSTKTEKVLPPLSASDRRIIHMALVDTPDIQTFSRGEGTERRLVIAPK